MNADTSKTPLIKELDEHIKAEAQKLEHKEVIVKADAENIVTTFLEKIDCEAPYNELVEYTCTALEISTEA